MISDFIQADYGAFDPRFLGVTLRFHVSRPAVWETFTQLAALSGDPAEVVRLGNAALTRPTPDAFEFFSLGTILSHELRHFHDFLLSSFGSAVFRLRLTAVFNGSQALGPLLRQGGPVPVPITARSRMSPGDRASLIAMWRSTVPGIDAVEHFTVPVDSEAHIGVVNGTYGRIRDFVTSHQAFEVGHLFEASAVIHQIQHVYSVFGAEHASLFGTVLLNEPSARNYSAVYRALDHLWDRQAKPADLRMMSAIVTWALLGDYMVDKWEASPERPQRPTAV